MEGSTTQENHFNSKRVKYILILLLYLITFILLALIFWSITHINFNQESSPLVCDDDVCNATALRLFKSIDFSVDPCDNFYQFVCGGYMKHAEIPEGKQKISPTLELQEKIEEELRNLLENISLGFKPTPKPFSTIAHLYSQCMDVDKIGRDGPEEAGKVFHDAGGWPLLDKKPLPNTWTFQDIQSKLLVFPRAANSLIKVSGVRNTSGVFFTVKPPDLGIPAQELVQGMKSPAVVEYLQYMVDMAVLYGVQKEEASTDMKRVLDFEFALAELINSKTDNSFSSEYTLKNLQEMPSLSWVPWTTLLGSMVAATHNITNNQSVVVVNPEYVIKLGELVDKKESSDIANYMMWRAAEELAPLVSEQMRQRHELHAGSASQPRWRWCLKTVSGTMGVALTSLYVTKHLEQRVKTSAETLANIIRQELVDNIRESALDERAKEEETDQARNIRTIVGYPDEMTDIEKVEAYYRELNPNKDKFLRAVLDINKWHHDSIINGTWVGTDEEGWSDLGDLSVPKATFSNTHRMITVNAGLLQPPLFSPDQPLYVNYGSIGYLVAHHFAHTMDDQSTKSSTESITYKDGLKVAYNAYRKTADQLPEPETLLPYLQLYTPGQLFMISMGNMLCVKQRSTDVVSDDRTTEGHLVTSPMEKKINGLVKNSADFKDLFRCKEN